MNKNEIFEILEDWNFWNKDLITGIRRSVYLDKLKQMISTDRILVITGARRSGKSFMMKQLAKELIEEGVERKRILIVNFEDPRFTGLGTQLLQKIYETYLEFLGPKDIPFIFLDEIQEVIGWEKWVNMMRELNKGKIVVSGSNAKLLSHELATLLTGRHLDMTLFPLSFQEFLEFNGLKIESKLDMVSKRTEIKNLLKVYIESGSFPEIVLANEKKQLLLTYFEDIVNKDMVKRYHIRKTEKLKSLLKFYLSNFSSLTTFNSLEKALGISADTIEKFSGYSSTAYLTFFLKRFSFKVKEQEKSPRKVYIIDSGLANAMGFRVSQNTGRLAENIVFLHLLRLKTTNPNLELFYWKDERHNEVDFLVKEGIKVINLIQTCWQIESAETKKREVYSLVKAGKELGLKEGLILTEDFEGKEEVDGFKIIITPIHKWLLNSGVYPI